jgi:hypothetical protein
MDNDRKQAAIHRYQKRKRWAIIKKLYPDVIPKIVNKPNGAAKGAKSEIEAEGEVMGKKLIEF